MARIGKPTLRRHSQKSYVKAALLSGSKITPLIAMNSWGIMRLAAVIHVLRHNEGYNIDTKMVARTNGSEYAQYSITA